jgi:hypothetical protein
VLTVLGGLAEFERTLIKARTHAGIARACAAGVRFGRQPKLNAHQQREAIARRDAGEPQSAMLGPITSIRRRFPGCGPSRRVTEPHADFEWLPILMHGTFAASSQKKALGLMDKALGG